MDLEQQTPPDDTTVDHGRALADTTTRLTRDFPDRASLVPTLVAEAFATTDGARIQTFRVVLAERDARARLLGRSPGDPGLRASA